MATFFVAFVFLGWPFSRLHPMVFAYWHQQQNDVVPRQYPCVVYEPTFSRLRAKYTTTSTEFQEWIAEHQWPLQITNEVHWQDQQWMGIESAELGYATEPSPNGKQLRAYHENGIAYISYNAF